MSKPETPKFVTALFSFKGKNNDELCFKKGDVITITQIDEGGWWEGTLHDKTGWFPSNYVKECRVPENSVSTMKATEKVLQESPVHQKLNRDIVLKDLVDSERVNVAELQGLINSFLHPLESANILNKEEYKQLLGNVHEVLEVHQRLLSNLEAAMTQDSRVGNLFLTLAPKLKSIHTMYCRNHPKAVCILDQYRDELNDFMERSGAISPGILVLTTGLSKPFRRLDKYSAMLQELERYTERNHPDRGDTQRSIAVYREIADRCASIRKQRELALQVLTSGIKGWEGEELSSLGEILYVGSVTLASGTTGLDRRDRYFVLFPTTLLVLSASPRMSSFVYEGKLPLTGITITQVEDTDEIRNAFEITGPMIESILVLCGSKEDQQRWIELLIQEQTTNNSLVKSSTTSRVSYSLPPYARLSRYFAKLVRQKIIRPELLKKLLYLQYVLRPDMSNVKMRRTNITTYVLHPMQTNSQDSCSYNYSTSFESNKIATGQPFVGTTMLRKSTLTLNVKYALPDIDLSTVGVTKGSSLTEVISTENTRGDISKSLPLVSVGSSITAGFANNNNNVNTVSVVDEQLACRSRFTNLARSFPIGCNFHQDTFGETKKHIDVAAAIKCWKSKEFTDEQSIIINSVHHPSVPVCNSNIIENCCQANVISVGSSDSGMAESYRLNSSEINSSCKSCTCVENKYSIEHPIRIYSDESENDENNFEYQCVCTSPFGSTPRDSAHLSDSSKHNDNTLDPPTCETASTIVYNSDHAFATNKIQTKENVLSNKYEHTMQRRFTQPIPYTHQSIVRKVGRKAIQPTRPVENDYNGAHQIYTSGLYAHWWLKKSIPFSGCSDQDLQSTKRETATTTNAATATTVTTTQINHGTLCLPRN
ncbi:rho-type guanine nucleotide exchange factor isoform X1 [Bombus vancouverensis nearcticus]|uniref:rho-type guanine nucleotide exchange factor isoform X1 n=1 Tax=Bombus vancouverensis nearcticus TaxID=2705178 RepID=UPI0021261F1F